MADECQSWPVIGPLIREQARPLPDGGRLSGIDKRPAAQPIWLGASGFATDQVLDRRWHGGADRALCIYPLQHYRRWQRLFAQASFGPGAFGENLCCDGLDESQLCIGDRLRWGQALLEVSQPRSPCVTLDRRHRAPGLSRALAQSGRTGWLCRVLEEGWVESDAPLLISQPAANGVSVAQVWRCYSAQGVAEPELRQLIELPQLAEHYRRLFRERLDRRRAERDQGNLFD